MFVARDKHVCLQCDLYLEVTRRDYLVSDEHVCLQCDSYLEVSRRDYLVSDEHVCLQCEIIFGGAWVAKVILSLAIKHVHLLFGSWYRNPLKKNKN